MFWTRRWWWLLALVAAAVLLPLFQLGEVPPPAEARSLPLPVRQIQGGTWESDPIQVNATVAGLSWEGQPPGAIQIRSSEDGVRWSDWVGLEVVPDTRPDPGTAEAARQRPASSPIYVGRARFLQYRVVAADPAQLRAEVVDTSGRSLSLAERAKMLWRRATFQAPGADAQPDRPAGIVTREQWGGDDCVGEQTVQPLQYVKRVRVMFVHHTVTTNDYSAAEAKNIVQGICQYHVHTLGWWDIAYNFLIDKYGIVYEGRGGGMDKGVQGAHTGGFNSYSTGVALLGTHTTVTPSQAAQDALVALAAWKLDLHHVDPTGKSILSSLGSSSWPEGTQVEFRNVEGHRAASATSCPGDACFVLIDGFRQKIDAFGGAKIYGGWPDPDPIGGSPEEGYWQATFRMRFTVPTDWTLRVLDQAGAVVFQASGSGSEAAVPWDGTNAGKPLPMGFYDVQVEGTTAQGAPLPVQDRFQLGAFLPPFVDDNGSAHELDIVAIYQAGITMGCNAEGTRYCPHDPVSRWQMAVFLARAMQLEVGQAPNAFSDDDGHQFEPYINALAQAEVTRGCGEGKFCPEAAVTRSEMAGFLLRAIEHGADDHLPAFRGLFPDVEGGTWYARYVEHLADHQITLGYPDGTFRPEGPLNREQMASFLARTFLGSSAS